MSRRYPQSFKDRAVRMVLERLEDEDAPARFTVIRQTAQKLSVSTEGLRRWVAGAEVDSGKKAGVSSDEQTEIRRLKWAVSRKLNSILGCVKKAEQYLVFLLVVMLLRLPGGRGGRPRLGPGC